MRGESKVANYSLECHIIYGSLSASEVRLHKGQSWTSFDLSPARGLRYRKDLHQIVMSWEHVHVTSYQRIQPLSDDRDIGGLLVSFQQTLITSSGHKEACDMSGVMCVT